MAWPAASWWQGRSRKPQPFDNRWRCEAVRAGVRQLDLRVQPQRAAQVAPPLAKGVVFTEQLPLAVLFNNRALEQTNHGRAREFVVVVDVPELLPVSVTHLRDAGAADEREPRGG